jgi:hypothetical protein
VNRARRAAALRRRRWTKMHTHVVIELVQLLIALAG